MGVDDYHVSFEHMAGAGKTKSGADLDELRIMTYYKIKNIAQRWFDGEIDDRRMAEAVFGLVNGGE